MSKDTSPAFRAVPLRRLDRATLGSRYDAALAAIHDLAARVGPDYRIDEDEGFVVVRLPAHANTILFRARAVGVILGFG
jgi:hypothetical protein